MAIEGQGICMIMVDYNVLENTVNRFVLLHLICWAKIEN